MLISDSKSGLTILEWFNGIQHKERTITEKWVTYADIQMASIACFRDEDVEVIVFCKKKVVS